MEIEPGVFVSDFSLVPLPRGGQWGRASQLGGNLMDDYYVTNRSSVAEFFGVETTTIDYWCKLRDRMPGHRASYDLREIAQWLAKRKGASMAPIGAGQESTEDATRRLRVAQADERELLNAQKKGELVSSDLLTQFLPRQALLLRGFGEIAERHFGKECLVMFNDHIDSVCDSTEVFVADLCEPRNGDEFVDKAAE